MFTLSIIPHWPRPFMLQIPPAPWPQEPIPRPSFAPGWCPAWAYSRKGGIESVVGWRGEYRERMDKNYNRTTPFWLSRLQSLCVHLFIHHTSILWFCIHMVHMCLIYLISLVYLIYNLSNRSDLIYPSIYSWWTMEDSWDTRVYNTVLIMGYTIWQSHLAGWKL